MLVWIAVAAGFRAYLATGINPGAGMSVDTGALISVSRALGAIVATVLWVFLSSVAVLFGGEVNAAIDRRRGSTVSDHVGDDKAIPSDDTAL
jgi:uncharacterized BrkB/YihY/UPF0761 family membrane protein